MTVITEKPLPDLFGQPRVDEVTESVHVARGFDLGNVIKVSTPEGAVVIDTSSRFEHAVNARDALAEAAAGEARFVVYTHCHNDHTSGAEAFVGATTVDVVAQALLPDLMDRDHGCLGRWTARHRSHQMGRPLDAPFPDRRYVAPSVLFDRTFELEVGGLTLHMEHTEGETRDHLLVWIPELGVLCPGDLFYPSFPNLSTPAVGPRPVQGWIRSLERFLELEPTHLVGSHGPVISGRDTVRDVLTAYRDAVRHVWDESVRAVDEGVPVHEAARSITLPQHLAEHPCLQEIYGTVNWGVRAVYDNLTGWYDLSPASLNPLPRQHRDLALIEVAGMLGIVARAQSALDAGDFQLALELTDVVLSGDALHPGANEIQAEACVALRKISTSANEKGFYRSGEVMARHRLATASGSAE